MPPIVQHYRKKRGKSQIAIRYRLPKEPINTNRLFGGKKNNESMDRLSIIINPVDAYPAITK